MKAIELSAFGGLDALTYRDLPTPAPIVGQVLLRVLAAGVGPWDAWIREGRSVVPQPLPLVPGSDISGIVAASGPGVTGFPEGAEVYGVTNSRFTGGYAEYAVAEATMIAAKPACLTHAEAASVPVVATTAWQMLFDHANARAGQQVLVLGGAGNVGAYAVQLARWAGLAVTATVSSDQAMPQRDFDIVIDTVGGAALEQSYDLVRTGGVLISAVSAPNQERAARHGIRAAFILVLVSTEGLQRLAALFDAGILTARVGEMLPLSRARIAHEMLAGRAHQPGKIVLVPPRGVPSCTSTH